jgi:hypothetical protein
MTTYSPDVNLAKVLCLFFTKEKYMWDRTMPQTALNNPLESESWRVKQVCELPIHH